MACVVYECLTCGNFWHTGGGDKCPQCGSEHVSYDCDENFEADDEWIEEE